MIKAAVYGLAALTLTYALPSSARSLAECGASFGQAHYDVEGTWGPDQISKGSYSFVADGKGNPNVLFRDATGVVVDAAADGGKVSFSFIHPNLGEFGMVVIYEGSGVVETYNVITAPSGERKLYWTSNKSRAAPLAKVAAFVAACR
jgi:hypothetical protein